MAVGADLAVTAETGVEAVTAGEELAATTAEVTTTVETQTLTSSVATEGAITQEQLAAHLMSQGFSEEAAASYASSFDGPITARMTEAGEQFFRYTGQSGTTGNFLSGTTFASPAEAAKALNLAPWGNPATVQQIVTANSPTLVFEGGIAGGALRV